MSYSASFRCVAGCDGTYPLDQVIYKCPECGELLEVQHDIDALKNRSGSAWMQAVRPALDDAGVAVRQRRLGQEGMGQPDREENIVSIARGRHQPVLGRALR